MGGQSDALSTRVREAYRDGLSLEEAVHIAVRALSEVEERPVEAINVEAAVLDRTRGRRKFRRLTDQDIAGILPT